MKRTEQIMVVLTLITLAMNFLLIPSGAILSILSIGVLALLYFGFGFAVFNNIRLRNLFKRESYSSINSARLAGAIGAGLALSMTTMGILYKFQLWPGADANLSMGLAGLAIILIIGLFKYLRNKSEYYSKILIRSLLFGAIGLFLFLIPMNQWVDLKYSNHPEYAQALKNAMADPNNPLLRAKAREEYLKIH